MDVRKWISVSMKGSHKVFIVIFLSQLPAVFHSSGKSLSQVSLSPIIWRCWCCDAGVFLWWGSHLDLHQGLLWRLLQDATVRIASGFCLFEWTWTCWLALSLHIHTCRHTRAGTYAQTHTSMHPHTHTHFHSHTHIHAHTHTHMHTHTRTTHTHTHNTHTCTHAHACMHACAHTHIHTLTKHTEKEKFYTEVLLMLFHRVTGLTRWSYRKVPKGNHASSTGFKWVVGVRGQPEQCGQWTTWSWRLTWPTHSWWTWTCSQTWVTESLPTLGLSSMATVELHEVWCKLGVVRLSYHSYSGTPWSVV